MTFVRIGLSSASSVPDKQTCNLRVLNSPRSPRLAFNQTSWEPNVPRPFNVFFRPKKRDNKCRLVAFAVLALLVFIVNPRQITAQQHRAPVEWLPTGQALTPTAAPGSLFQTLRPDIPGRKNRFADDAVSNAVSPDGNTLLVLTSGYYLWKNSAGHDDKAASTEYVLVFDISRGAPRPVQTVPVPRTFGGIVWNPNGQEFYVTGGPDDVVHSYAKFSNSWAEFGTPIPLGHSTGLGLQVKPMPAGLDITANGERLVVANYENDSITVVDLNTRKVTAELDLRPGKTDTAKAGTPGGEFPYGVVIQGNDRAYVASVRDREIIAVDLNPKPHVAARIPLHGQPNKLTLNRKQTRLYISEDNADTLAVVDTATNQIIGELGVTAPVDILAKLGGFKGSNPNNVALSPDERTAYVTLGGANAVAVVRLKDDGSPSEVFGLIPTGWYPNAVSLNRAGTMLYVANGKSGAGPNPDACRKNTKADREEVARCNAANQYILQLTHGGLLTAPVPTAAALPGLTRRVSENNRWPEVMASNAASQKLAALQGKIHHVVYIIKENRSYDQVLGELEKGNGDPHLAILPEPLTPNHHQIARQFVTLDNLMASGEVSGDGWNWSTAARGTDALEKDIRVHYAGGALTYDEEGTTRNLNVGIGDMAARRQANPATPSDADLLPGTADLLAPDGPGGPGENAGAGYLWDAAIRSGLTLRNYGFFVDLARYEMGADIPVHLYPPRDARAQNLTVAFPSKPALAQVTDPYFAGFDLRLADYWRFKEWEHEFDGYVTNGNLPALEFLRLPHDHFGNFKDAMDGVNTVETEMADNDYAVGLVLQKIAASPYAKDTVVFAIEDDAQNGPDHMDAHRTVALVAGAFVKQGAVDSGRYTTVSMLRTIEVLLGMSPMGLYDAATAPMADSFTAEYTPWTYTARVPRVLRTTQLPLPPEAAASDSRDPALFAFEARYAQPRHDANWWAAHMRGQDFSVEDDLDTDRFNHALWLGLVGPGVKFPSHATGLDLSKGREQLLAKFLANPRN
jgi:DNA-binding beta-propeller fold protein YncE